MARMNDFRTECWRNFSFTKRFTKPADMANGANVLLKTILAIDKE